MEFEIGDRLLNYRRRTSWNLPGHAHFITFSCYQRRPYLKSQTCCEWLCAGIRTACDAEKFRLWAYVFMPEHVHLLVFPTRAQYSMSLFLKRMKLPVVRRVHARLKRDHSDFLKQNTFGKSFHFWQAGGGHDLNIHSWKNVIAKAEYCHANPVKRKLVDSVEAWRWSSFRWLVMGERNSAPLRLDDWDDSYV